MRHWNVAGQWAAIVAVVLWAAAPARATVMYEYRSVCEIDCANVGLAAGDAVGGFIGVSDEAAAAGVLFSPADIETFDIHFGSFTFSLPSLGSAFAVFTGLERQAFSFQFITNASGSNPGYAFAQSNWVAGGSVFQAAYGGPGSLRLVAPEPGPVVLAGAALLALLLGRARRA